MEQLLLAFVSGLLVTLLTTPISIWFAKKYGLVDDPKSRPHPAHIQTRVVPRAGGLPIYLGIVTSILMLVPMDKHILGILISITILLIMGLIDDKLQNFSPYIRAGLQFLAAVIVVFSGVGISYTTNPLGGIFRLDQWVIPINFFGQHNIVVIADLFAFFWIVWVMNVINWSKGVDGQMPGIIVIAALTIGSVAYSFYQLGDPNQFHLVTLSLITAGSALAFLIFNWHPAKIFPGFSGSTILGFMIAVLAILTSAKIATALLVLLIPVVDFIYTFFRRILQGKSPVWGDRGHLHHKLLDLGWSHHKISLFYILSCTFLGLISIFGNSSFKFIIAITFGITCLIVIYWLQYRSNNQLKKKS